MAEHTGGKKGPEVRKLGKRETKIRLDRGQVPAEPIFNVIERAGFNMNYLITPRIAYRWRVMGYIPFRSADEVMTKAGLNTHWHFNPELKELYFAVNLERPKNYIPSKDSPVVHGDTRKYEAGCRCLACERGYSEGKGRRRKEKAA